MAAGFAGIIGLFQRLEEGQEVPILIEGSGRMTAQEIREQFEQLFRETCEGKELEIVSMQRSNTEGAIRYVFRVKKD